MNNIKLLLGALLLSGLVLGLAACGQSNAETEQPETQEPMRQALTVRVQEVQLLPFTDVIQTTGIVKAQEDVMLSPEEGGVVKEWVVKKGQAVKKGQVLGILNDDVIKASYEAAQAQYNTAQLNYEMQRSVYREKAISELQFKNSQYARDAAKAQADLMKARFDRTRIKSPIDGIFDENFYDEGEFAPPGVPIAHIVNVQSVKIAADVTERYAGRVKVGDLVRIVPDASPEDTLEARINYVGASVSASNRTLPIEIHIQNSGLRLKPEMITRVNIVRSERLNAILVDENIVQQVDRGKMVVFVENNGVAEQRIVKLGSRQGSLLEVIQGLKPGDRVIISDVQKLVNGQSVNVNS